jgi:hypothetical protein
LLFDLGNRIGGIIFCAGAFIIGFPNFKRDLKEYVQAKMENDEQKKGSALSGLSQSGGLVFFAICVLIYVIINWTKLK